MQQIHLRNPRRHALHIALALLVGAGLAAGLTAMALRGLPADAQPARSVLACITTDLETTVHFQYRTAGADRWVDAVAVPGQWMPIEHDGEPTTAADEGHAGELLVRYDDDPGEGKRVVRQTLPGPQARSRVCTPDGNAYVFRERDDELFLDEADGSVGPAADDAPQDNRRDAGVMI